MQIMYNTLCAYHLQHVVSRTKWHKGTAQLLSLTVFKLHSFELFYWQKPLTDEGGEELEFPEKTPDDEFQTTRDSTLKMFTGVTVVTV